MLDEGDLSWFLLQVCFKSVNFASGCFATVDYHEFNFLFN